MMVIIMVVVVVVVTRIGVQAIGNVNATFSFDWLLLLLLLVLLLLLGVVGHRLVEHVQEAEGFSARTRRERAETLPPQLQIGVHVGRRVARQVRLTLATTTSLSTATSTTSSAVHRLQREVSGHVGRRLDAAPLMSMIVHVHVVVVVVVVVVVIDERVGAGKGGQRRVGHDRAVIAFAYDQVDLRVDEYHGYEGQVKVDNGRGRLEQDVLVVLGLALVGGHEAHALVEEVVPADDGHQPQQRHAPRQADHEQSAPLRPLAQILERRRDRPVAVERQCEQVEYGGRARRIVGRQPDLTHRQR